MQSAITKNPAPHGLRRILASVWIGLLIIVCKLVLLGVANSLLRIVFFLGRQKQTSTAE